MLGIWTQGRRMVGAEETTELWRPPTLKFVYDIVYPEQDIEDSKTKRTSLPYNWPLCSQILKVGRDHVGY